MNTVEAVRRQIRRYKKPAVGYVTVPSPTLMQARVTRNRQTWRETFSIHDYGGSIAATYRAARSYLNRLSSTLPPRRRIRDTCSPWKTSDLPPGVSIASSYDKRRGFDYKSVMVYWKDGNRGRNKTFHIGRADIVAPADYQAVIDIAIEFRRAYENARAAGQPFDPRPWHNWRRRLPHVTRKRLATPTNADRPRRALAFNQVS